MVPANTLPYARQERVKVGGFGCQITGCQSMKTTITGGCALGHSTLPLGGNPGNPGHLKSKKHLPMTNFLCVLPKLA